MTNRAPLTPQARLVRRGENLRQQFEVLLLPPRRRLVLAERLAAFNRGFHVAAGAPARLRAYADRRQLRGLHGTGFAAIAFA